MECLRQPGAKRTESPSKLFYWQRILRNEAYIEQKQGPSDEESKPDLPVAFVELKPASGEKPCFQPDMIIRSRGIVVELSNTVSPELLWQIRGILHLSTFFCKIEYILI